MDHVVVLDFSNFDSFKLVPFLIFFLARNMERPPSTLGELIIGGFYVWDRQAMHLDSHNHSPSCIHSSVEIYRGMTAEALQAHEVDDSVPANDDKSVSLKTFCIVADTEKQILDFIGQLFDLKHPLCDIVQQHRNQVLRSFLSCGYN